MANHPPFFCGVLDFFVFFHQAQVFRAKKTGFSRATDWRAGTLEKAALLLDFFSVSLILIPFSLPQLRLA